MKLISIVIPTYNEKDNIIEGYNRVKNVMENIQGYDYEIIFIDNHSTDGTRDLLRRVANEEKKAKVIFNAVNVGWNRSSFYGITQAKGDMVVLLSADMQEPPEIIPQFIEEYEKGNKIVVGIKSKSNENPLMYFFRNLYYRFLKKIAEIKHIEQFMGFGLYDKSFVDVLRKLDDPLPYLRGMIVELGADITEVRYTQDVRKKGKTHFNFWSMYDLAMLGITSYSKLLLRLSTIFGVVIGCASIFIVIVTFILKVFSIIDYPIGTAAIIISLLIFAAFILFFVGLLGEYIININTRIMNRPLVIEELRLNFDDKAVME